MICDFLGDFIVDFNCSVVDQCVQSLCHVGVCPFDGGYSRHLDDLKGFLDCVVLDGWMEI